MTCTRGLLLLIAAFALTACRSDERERALYEKPTTVQPGSDAPLEPLSEAKAPRGQHDPGIASLLSNLKYKPDPYETQPACVSEPTSQQRDELILWVELSLMRDPQGAITLNQAHYAVTTADVPARAEEPDVAGIPRLELVHSNGRITHTDFEGSYREPHRAKERRTSDATPRDPLWVLSWLASARMTKDVTAHRVVLDGRVLQEVKRPDHAPRLDQIACDDTGESGLKLFWRTEKQQTHVPLLVEVMRVQKGGLVELMPSKPAREVQGFTVPPAQRSVSQDELLVVALTNTFHFVTRGVLVPRRAL